MEEEEEVEVEAEADGEAEAEGEGEAEEDEGKLFLKSNNASGYTGVYQHGQRWQAKHLNKHIGTFATPEMAARAYLKSVNDTKVEKAESKAKAKAKSALEKKIAKLEMQLLGLKMELASIE